MKNNSTLRETSILTLGELIVSLLTVGGFALAGLAFEINILSVVLGAVLGSLVTVLNYFFLSLSVNRSVDKYLELRGESEMTDEEAAIFTAKHSMQIQNAIRTSFLIRLISMVAALVVAFVFLNVFNPLATAIPLLAYRPILTVSEIIRKKFDKAPDPSKFIVYSDESDEDEENADKTNDQEKESDE